MGLEVVPLAHAADHVLEDARPRPVHPERDRVAVFEPVLPGLRRREVQVPRRDHHAAGDLDPPRGTHERTARRPVDVARHADLPRKAEPHEVGERDLHLRPLPDRAEHADLADLALRPDDRHALLRRELPRLGQLLERLERMARTEQRVEVLLTQVHMPRRDAHRDVFGPLDGELGEHRVSDVLLFHQLPLIWETTLRTTAAISPFSQGVPLGQG